MVKKKYLPERGDIVWLDFNPQTGHEQKGKRPAIVISPKEYNEKTGLGLFCPITSKIKNYPFEARIENKKINGVVLSDQIKSLDWEARGIEFIAKETSEKTDEIIGKIRVLFE
ncbi:MAG: endoribonuclease MazF [Treponema sp.]|jgi:mRNA interferase MazF|nr:endoribonuclease MazF [Treponema sp.]